MGKAVRLLLRAAASRRIGMSAGDATMKVEPSRSSQNQAHSQTARRAVRALKSNTRLRGRESQDESSFCEGSQSERVSHGALSCSRSKRTDVQETTPSQRSVKGRAEMDASFRQLVYEWCTFQSSEHAKGRPFIRALNPMHAHH